MIKNERKVVGMTLKDKCGLVVVNCVGKLYAKIFDYNKSNFDNIWKHLKLALKRTIILRNAPEDKK